MPQAQSCQSLMVLFVKGFPFGTSEPFLENEWPLYPEYFDHTLIVTPNTDGKPATRSVSTEGISVLPVDIHSLKARIWAATRVSVLPDFYFEVRRLIKTKSLSFPKVKQLILMAGKALALQEAAKNWVRDHPEYEVKAVYAYWLNYPAYAAGRFASSLNPKPWVVSRAHGHDLYENRAKYGYDCLKDVTVASLNKIYSISQDGTFYLQKRFPDQAAKFEVCRLGAHNCGMCELYTSRETFRIVSCSRLVPVKRVQRIADALAVLSKRLGRRIEWVHFGGGQEEPTVKIHAAALPNSVSWTLTGALTNSEIYERYRTEEFHVFVNVSESEGIPVAVMEAMSFGIPAIATNVGGVRELVNDPDCGRLLDKEFTDEQLAQAMSEIADMDESEYLDLRKSARRKFEEEYDAEKNYRAFLSALARGKNEDCNHHNA